MGDDSKFVITIEQNSALPILTITKIKDKTRINMIEQNSALAILAITKIKDKNRINKTVNTLTMLLP